MSRFVEVLNVDAEIDGSHFPNYYILRKYMETNNIDPDAASKVTNYTKRFFEEVVSYQPQAITDAQMHCLIDQFREADLGGDEFRCYPINTIETSQALESIVHVFDNTFGEGYILFMNQLKDLIVTYDAGVRMP